MSTDPDPSIGEVLPTDAWDILKAEKSARLIDVRTQAEWNFVGKPDLSGLGHTTLCVEWVSFPGMSKNLHFVESVLEDIGDGTPGKLLFLCRSGVRSLHAARAVTAWFSEQGVSVKCLNVAEGFEGDLNDEGKRGIRNGWKHRGLAWRQS